MILDLNRSHWKLKGYWPYTPLFRISFETANDIQGVTDWFDATVPGGVQQDLVRAGLIEDYRYELNSLKCEWVEHRWWMYHTDFRTPKEFAGRRLSLVFKGLDYKSHIFLNGQKLAEHEGMFDAVTLNVTDKVCHEAENDLSVLFENVPWEIAQIGYTDRVRTQKSRFNYKWDFSTRLVNIGIWDDVLLKAAGSVSIGEKYIHTDVDGSEGLVRVACTLQGAAGDVCTVKSMLEYAGKPAATREEKLVLAEGTQGYDALLRVPSARLWYPNGAGEQPLYHLRIEVYQDGVLSDAADCDIGIRSLRYARNPGSGEDSLPYTLVVNGRPVYIKGMNLTSFDLMYGAVTEDVYERYLKLLKLCNVNLVRINGVGIIEKECFYDLCDRYGIMVWQDFIQSGSGIDSVPASDPQYMELLEKASVQAIRDKRNHASHAVWCGGNELSYRHTIPLGFEDPNVQKLAELVELHDPGKLFLPSTPSGPMFFNDAGKPGKNHDVHGNWKYEGVEAHYQKQNESSSLFHSEFGVDGMNALASLQKFMGESHVRVTNTTDDFVWRHHGELWDTLARDEELFGKFDSLGQFIKASQFIQAEGLRYIVEANRRRQPENSGSMVWQFNEPWPNVSCTCLVDYYSVPKMAYYWAANAYSPVHVSLRYGKLRYAPQEAFEASVYAHNDAGSLLLSVVWEILDVRGAVVQSGESKADADSGASRKITGIAVQLPPMPSGLFFVRLRLRNDGDAVISENLYVFSQTEQPIFSNLLHLTGGSLRVDKCGEGYRIKNEGEAVCLFVHGSERTGNRCIHVDGNYSSLFPGEERLFSVKAVDALNETAEADLNIDWDFLNSL